MNSGFGVWAVQHGRKLVAALVLIRVITAAFLSGTYFVPDEYWQSLEVAHRLVFGYGYLTWEWLEGIRGYFHPLLFACLYRLLAWLHLDYPWSIVVGPRILQACATAWSDYRLFWLASRYFTLDTAPWVLICQLCTWTSIYCLTRTLSNSLETALCTIALSYWPWPWLKRHEDGRLFWALVFAALSCLTRPTAALLWAPLVLQLLLSNLKQATGILFKLVMPIAVVSLVFSAALDSVCYGRPVFIQWNFLRFNFLSDLGSFYGANPWYWYFTAGLPMLLGTSAIPMIIGIWVCRREQKLLAVVGLLVVLANSCVTHKEFRFLLPLLPLAAMYAGRGVQYALAHWRMPLAVGIIVTATLPQLAAAFYLGTVHQSGSVSVMEYLRAAASTPPYSSQPSKFSVLFLMPCHSTPFYSHMHLNTTLDFLTCPPSKPHFGEDRLFYANPLAWLGQRFGKTLKDIPSHLVLFDVLEGDIREWLKRAKYHICAEYFHSHFPEGRIGGKVLVYCQPVQ